MRKIVSFILIMMSALCHAQDVIVLKTGEEIQAKIVQVTDVDVSYKKFDYQDGPTFVVAKNKIFMIKYADGTKDVISQSSTSTANNSVSDSTVYGRNIISINPFSFIGGNFGLSYERISSTGRIGIRIPVLIPVLAKYGNQLGGSVDVKFYFQEPKKVNYYAGPSLFCYVDYYNHVLTGIMAQNGVSFQPSKMFNITLDAGLGMAYESPHRDRAFFNVFTYRFGVNFGIRF